MAAAIARHYGERRIKIQLQLETSIRDRVDICAAHTYKVRFKQVLHTTFSLEKVASGFWHDTTTEYTLLQYVFQGWLSMDG